jgi:hypothetical protein
MIGVKSGLLAGALILTGLALWWRWGLFVVLAEPMWLCFSR